MADHVLCDNVMPEIVFGRKHTIGVGDSYCDHMVRIRTPEEKENDESNYEDTYKAKYGARDVLKKWDEHYKTFGKFKF